MERRWLVVELGVLAIAIAGAWWLGGVATDAWIARVEGLGVDGPSAASVRAAARTANLSFSAGVAVLAAARAVVVIRARDPLPVPALIPAAVLACLLGLILHHATVEVAAGRAVLPTARGFAQGFLLGAVLGAVVLVLPRDPAWLATRLQVPLAIAIAAIFAALALAGSGPGGSGTRINLGPVQPIEAVKPMVVLLLAGYLGARASKLRWQRRRWLGLRWPRLELLVPGLLALLGIFAGLFVIGDLGPVMLLAAVFLGMFYLVSRATGPVVLALALIAALLVLIAVWPELVDTGRVATRIRIWNDPWGNGLSHGHQVGEALWAIAAGGPWGQGLGAAAVPLPPAGKTDLVLAPLIEQLGAAGLVGYLGLLGAIALTGLMIAARSRTAERVLIAGGGALLLVVQWALIHAGTFGVLPLTGIVAPFLSSGRSSMVAFLVLVAMLARLSLDARARVAADELDELHAGARGLAGVVVVLLVAGVVVAIDAAVVSRAALSGRRILVTLRDGTVIERDNPRLLAIARAIRRGSILDRRGEPLAISDQPGARRYPVGRALGTLLGVDPSPVLRPPWALERMLDERLRGYAALRELVPLLARSPAARRAAVAAIDRDVAARSVRLSIDAALQQRIAALVATTVEQRRGAAVAVVVIDVDTGQVLARVQDPDYDPGDPAWHPALGDAAGWRRFQGAYGAWPDKTGLHGMFQAGSVAKLFTALAAIRAGVATAGRGCQARTTTRYACDQRDEQGPLWTRPGWPRPIHDHGNDPTHGAIELAGALAVSCNVYFGQLGVALGPGPLVALRQAGAEVGYAGAAGFDPGAPGSRRLASTGFGQGAMVLSPLQAARLVAAIAGGGHYRRCPPSMELDAACTDTALVDDPEALAPVLAGMRLVMTDGTGKRLREPAGLRVYGKTGTADAAGFVGEEPFGIAPAAPAPPHAWFVAFAEPAAVAACSAVAPGRIAVAVVVPRGGAGATTAGPIAMQVLAAARELGYLGGR